MCRKKHEKNKSKAPEEIQKLQQEHAQQETAKIQAQAKEIEQLKQDHKAQVAELLVMQQKQQQQLQQEQQEQKQLLQQDHSRARAQLKQEKNKTISIGHARSPSNNGTAKGGFLNEARVRPK